MIKEKILSFIKKAPLIIDGAMGTELQKIKIDEDVWIYEGNNLNGCNELLNITAPNIIQKVYRSYLVAGANFITTNTFGSLPWVLEEYNISNLTYKSAFEGARLAKELVKEFDSIDEPRFVLGSLGPGTKLPSLGHISYDEMYNGYKEATRGLIDGGADLILLETCQDPLQIKSAINAIRSINKDIPIMVSVTIELSGTMLIGTDAFTIATILEPFDILSLGFNCGTGPEQVKKHIEVLSKVWHKPISIHANAGLPQNRGGFTFYPMGPDEFSKLQSEFLEFDGVSFLGGCCGTTPQHIAKLKQKTKNITPKIPTGSHPKSLASLFSSVPLKQTPPPLLIGERCNATGSKAFRELLKAQKYDEILSVANEQVNSGAHVLDVSVGFAGRDESKDMFEVISRFASKISLPLMPDSTQIPALETALKLIGGKAIINSVNFEDGVEKFDQICHLAKTYGASLVCLTIDEKGMAKTKQRKLEIAKRIYERAVNVHKIDPRDLVFDMLVFTIGSGDEEYFDAGIQTIEAIKEFSRLYPECGTTLGLSNISFGLEKNARIYLNSVFLNECINAGLTSAIVNVKHILPLNKISEADKKVCLDLIYNKRDGGDPLFAFIEHFSNVEVESQSDEEFEKLSDEEKIKKLLMDGNKEKLIEIALMAKDKVGAEKIVNEWLIDGMKVIGELFGNGQMQLPFVLQSAEAMKSCVDKLNPYLPKIEKSSQTTLILGTVKGDVHDVGKNLVDIILSNNGFKVVNIGIKVEISQFIDALKKYNATAIGMSGLLVKSTNEMKNNLIELKKAGIDIPVLLGGAALNKAFIDEYCRPNYDGPIFYCKDAFDGVVAMQRLEKAGDNYKDVDVKLGEDVEKKVKKEKEVFDPKIHKPTMLKNNHNFNPPFCGRKIFNISNLKELAFSWINKKLLFRQRWGYAKKNLSKDEYEKLIKDEVEPLFYELKELFLQSEIFSPIAIYGYYPCKANDNILEVYNCQKKDIIATFEFPRSAKEPHRAIADFFKSDEFDWVAFTFASSGLNIAEYEQKLYQNGEYKKYFAVHGLGVELAEAIAEILHKQIRLDLGIAKDEGVSLKDVKLSGYQGCRYSPGYAACPNLELNKEIFKLLKPEEFGISLSETFQIHPEQSTVAIITPNKEAKYFSV